MAMRIRRDDEVQVIAGKDRGKRGRVMRVDPKRQRVFVEGLNMIKRHQRPRQVANPQSPGAAGGVIEREGPIHISNVMVLDPAQARPTRVGVRSEGTRRFRVARRSGQRL